MRNGYEPVSCNGVSYVKNIFIISHNDHAFLRSEILRASEQFEKVLVLAPLDARLLGELKARGNVDVVPFKRSNLKFAALPSIRFCLEKEVIKELAEAAKNGLLSFRYVKELLFYLAFRSRVIKVAKKYDINENQTEWTILSMWYSADAYATYKLGQLFPETTRISLAHSYEVDPVKSPFIRCLFRGKYHESFDYVSFISSQVFEAFKYNVADVMDLSLHNVGIDHLGIDKLAQESGSPKRKEMFRIVSCSHVVPVKRLNLLFGALDAFASFPICWTHIGGGSGYESLKKMTESKKNQYLSIDLRGPMENGTIHRLYATEWFDLFVNVSSSEGVPVSIMEALAYGLPIVATDVGGNKEIVADQFGILLKSNPETSEIWNAIEQVHGWSREKMTAARASAKTFFGSNYSSKAVRASFYAKIKNRKFI